MTPVPSNRYDTLQTPPYLYHRAMAAQDLDSVVAMERLTIGAEAWEKEDWMVFVRNGGVVYLAVEAHDNQRAWSPNHNERLDGFICYSHNIDPHSKEVVIIAVNAHHHEPEYIIRSMIRMTHLRLSGRVRISVRTEPSQEDYYRWRKRHFIPASLSGNEQREYIEMPLEVSWDWILDHDTKWNEMVYLPSLDDTK